MILVTGATGNVGRHVVRELLERGTRVRVVAEHTGALEGVDGVEAVQGDLTDPDTQAAVVEGAEALFLMAIPGTAEGVSAAAKSAGVERIVVLSSLTADEDAVGQSSAIGAFHRGIEKAVEDSGVHWTHLRPNLLASNALLWAPAIRADRMVHWPFARAATSPVHEKDIAAVAVEALVTGDHLDTVYPLTGPQSLTQAEQARLIGEAIGAEVGFDELPEDVARTVMTRMIPADAVDAVLRFLARSVGKEAVVLPTVEQVTGRPGRAFAQWAAENADAFR
ncbi:NAD(P)H-binding protein [Wenjunlia tyrosinilytica]|uniref:NmrA family transcriptional regulator n=1 Tax=Wenjunlia tyrosinilytica TaxID=1544741 RepID=A0A917ZHZ3_9ACTN|nr:NAD(P)H-binding protein [Wenjunlia tyrosinilytica]GGO83331.1 NmrA family transcriptional regulator [Wenjunlia tyrosinilytica]